MEDNNKNSRRSFLDKSFKLGLLGVVGGVVVSKLTDATAQEGEKVKVLTQDGKVVEVDSTAIQKAKHAPHAAEYKVREGFPGRKFVMVIDLAKCKNALKCVDSCNKEHNITTPNAWLKVYKMQNTIHTSPYWQPVFCQHCDKPPCVTVCPVDATFKRRDGIVLIDNERCIGCRFCMAACPYSVRVFNWGDPKQPVLEEGYEYTPDHGGLPSQVGTVDKCDFCPHAIAKGELPHCVTACPQGVFYFGDLYEDTVTNGDETVKFSKLIKDKAGYRLLEGLGTSPSIYYLPPVDRLVDFDDADFNFEQVQYTSSSNPETE
ncbi:MAG: 4Fe-4S dicluster domain-containing protein [Flavobacteriaceae bacterium]|nr:4Fe-4S dicluster domain-containing protein [Flavobacteriaceae bacterium]